VGEVSRLYAAQDQHAGTHLALRWKGRVRYIVPHGAAAQQACWKVFSPGKLGVPLRAMVFLPGLLGAVHCNENDKMALVREKIGQEAGLSCCRAGAPGPWPKETVLVLEKTTNNPLYLVKVGGHATVDSLLQNEATWLHNLRGQPSLSCHIPELVAHRSGNDFCFIAQRALSGSVDFSLREQHAEFLRKLQDFSVQTMRYEDSRLCRTLRSRVQNLSGLLTAAWSRRIEKAMLRIEQSLAGPPIPLVVAHNDFTGWNTRIERGVAKVFDWEYANDEQLPLFDPLHFALAPMALHGGPPARVIRTMDETIERCRQWFGQERCYQPATQALAYLINLCTQYLSVDCAWQNSHPTLVCHAHVIDSMCGS
jgi:hypothetical protein